MTEQSTPITADAIRYAASLKAADVKVLRRIARDAADQIERMQTNFEQVMQFAQQLQSQSQEWEAERTQNHDFIEKLQREIGELQLKLKDPTSPEEMRPVLIEDHQPPGVETIEPDTVAAEEEPSAEVYEETEGPVGPSREF